MTKKLQHFNLETKERYGFGCIISRSREAGENPALYRSCECMSRFGGLRFPKATGKLGRRTGWSEKPLPCQARRPAGSE